MSKKISKQLEDDIKYVGKLKVIGSNTKILDDLGIPKSKQTYNMMLAIATYEAAIQGNPKFFDLILSVLGSKTVDKIAKDKLNLERERVEIEKLKNDVVDEQDEL